ncbi:hypothetical protein THAOC_26572, partial [Thalassiosira oceanica]
AQFRPVSACHAVDVNATMPQGARRSGRGGGGGRGRNKDTSRRPASGRGATKARRTSSGGTGRCESEAWGVDSATRPKAMYVASHDRKSGRRVDSASRQPQWTCMTRFCRRFGDKDEWGLPSALKITRDDINDEVKRRKKKKKKEDDEDAAEDEDAAAADGDYEETSLEAPRGRYRAETSPATAKSPQNRYVEIAHSTPRGIAPQPASLLENLDADSKSRAQGLSFAPPVGAVRRAEHAA